MEQKLLNMIDELENEIADLENRIEKQIESAFPSNKPNTGKLREYLLSQGMPAAWQVCRRIGTGDMTIYKSIKGGYIVQIFLTRSGIKSAELVNFSQIKPFSDIDIAEYEQLRHDFTTAVHFFEKLDYKALDAKIHEIGFSVCDKLSNQIRCTFNIKCALSRFKNEMKASEV